MTKIEMAIETLKDREHCMECVHTSKTAKNPACEECDEAFEKAYEALQEKAEREDPQPLTIEELRQMDGEPVWFETGEVSINEQTLGKWAIITGLTDKALWITAAVMPRYGNAWKYDSYGKTWFVYKYKPKEGKQ